MDDNIHTAEDIVNIITQKPSTVIPTPVAGLFAWNGLGMGAEIHNYFETAIQATRQYAHEANLPGNRVLDITLLQQNSHVTDRFSEAAKKAANHNRFRQRTKIVKLEERTPA